MNFGRKSPYPHGARLYTPVWRTQDPIRTICGVLSRKYHKIMRKVYLVPGPQVHESPDSESA